MVELLLGGFVEVGLEEGDRLGELVVVGGLDLLSGTDNSDMI